MSAESPVPLSGEELAALRQVTENATPGPWAVEERKMGRRTMLVVESRAYSDEEPGICGWHSSAWPLTDYDAAYIAALSPSVVARLLAMVERAQEEVDGLRGDCLALAKLAAGTPQFFNPLHVYEARAIRDRVLARAASPETEPERAS